MLSRFSWHDYWLFIAATTAVYYIAVIGLYFRGDIARLLFGKIHPPVPGKQMAPEFYGTAQQDNTNPQLPELNSTSPDNVQQSAAAELQLSRDVGDGKEPDDNPEAYELNEEDLELIKTVSEALAVAISEYDIRANKKELLLRIAHTISGITPPDRLRPFRESLDWHIGQQLLLHTGLDPTRDELERIWAIAETDAQDFL